MAFSLHIKPTIFCPLEIVDYLHIHQIFREWRSNMEESSSIEHFPKYPHMIQDRIIQSFNHYLKV